MTVRLLKLRSYSQHTHAPHHDEGEHHTTTHLSPLRGDGVGEVSALLSDDRSVFSAVCKENVDVQLECGERFILKEVVVKVPERSRCPVRSGIVFVSNATIISEETAKYNDLTQEQFRELQNQPKPGTPVCYFHISKGVHQTTVPVPSSPTGKFILVKFLKSRGRKNSRGFAISDSDNLQVAKVSMEVEFIGFYGEIITGLPQEPEVGISSEESEETATPLPVDDEPTNALSESENESDILVHTPHLTPIHSSTSIKPPSPRSPFSNLRERLVSCTPSISIKIPIKKLKLSSHNINNTKKSSSSESELDKSRVVPIITEDIADNALSSAPSSQGNSPPC